jgi:four helix bundle protein
MDKDNGVMFSFERLDAYIEARKLVKEIYLLLNAFPKIETYALSDQIRRSAISITSNIAEGSGRSSIKEKIHFLEISYASMLESYSQLQIALDLGYITSEEFEKLQPLYNKVASLLSGLRRSYEKSLLPHRSPLNPPPSTLTPHP